MGDESSGASVVEPVAPKTITLQGGVQEEFNNQPPGGAMTCPVAGKLSDPPPPHPRPPRPRHRPRLRGSAQQQQQPNPKLVRQTPQLAPTQPHTAQLTGHPPLQAAIYDRNHPTLGAWVPPDQRNNLPPGEYVDPDGYLHPQEAAPEDWQDELFVAGSLASWAVNLFGRGLLPLLPRPVLNPDLPALEEEVWVSVTENGKIIWREGETWFGKTAKGYYTTLSNALKNGARPKLPGYARAGGK
jgi:hypothetical protein